jgi:hypothetical protein
VALCIIWGGTGQAKVIRPILNRQGYSVIAKFDALDASNDGKAKRK